MAGSALASWEDESIIMRPLEDDECILEILDKPMVDEKSSGNLNCDKVLPDFEAELARTEGQGLFESNNTLQEASSSSTSSLNTNSSNTSTLSIVDLLTLLSLEKKENARLEEQLVVRQKYLQDLKDELERLNKSNAEAEAALAVGGEAYKLRENCTLKKGRDGLKRKLKHNGKSN